MARLGVNIDHVASIRQLRKGFYPSPVEAAVICQKAGANAIVVHLREDRRHINDQDLINLKKTVKNKLNLEMSVSKEIVQIACKIKPQQATLVPEKRQELTTEGGLDVTRNLLNVEKAFYLLKKAGVSVSLFIDPDLEQIKATHDLGIKNIELHTGHYANATTQFERNKFLNKIIEATRYAKKLGINVFAGHGLDYENIKEIRKIKEIEEYNIGYSIICQALFIGLDKAVRKMKALVK